MQVYAIRMFNFMRFGERNNSVVFDLSEEQKSQIANETITIDAIYNEVIKDPLLHVQTVKARGIETMIGIIGKIDGTFDRSNGSGKSTILESICYSHYEKVVRKLANTDKEGKAGTTVVTKHNGKYPAGLKESWVEEIFEENNKVYRIKRGRSFTKSHKSS
ncbi:MAG: AAA family ATPase, partial [bacterium]